MQIYILLYLLLFKFIRKEIMAHFQEDILEFIDDYLDMADYYEQEEDDTFQRTQQQPNLNLEDSDGEDDYIDMAQMDTLACEVRNEKETQGIPWERPNFTRDR